MQFKQYPSYKNSGVEWLGDVPDEWDIYPFWHLFNRKEITNKTQEQLLSVYLDRGVILHSEGGGMVHKPADNLEKYQLVEVNDFVMNNQQAWRGSVGVSPYKGIVSPAYLIFSFNKKICAPKFFKYFLRDKGVVDQFMIASMSVGTIQRQVKWHLLKTIQLSIPSLIEQNTIANFLDTETARIDNLIAKQEKLIELLEEQRKSIISHAVTKGLNPNAPMKDSGVEWLGEVPEGWGLKPLKLLVQTQKGFAFHSDIFSENGVGVTKASDIKNCTILKPSTFLAIEKFEDYKKYQLLKNDIIISTVGSTPDVINSAVGQIGILPESLTGCLLNQNTVIFRSNDEVNQLFLYYFLLSKSYRNYLDLYAHGTANQASLSIVDMLAFNIPLPSLNEQAEIIRYLDIESERFNKLTKIQNQLIEKLKEYRSSIISHAVTGKIDVREWVA